MQRRYVLGFVFNETYSHVLLVEKSRPEWQAGCLNGIGGKIEGDESPLGAMHREMLQETCDGVGDLMLESFGKIRGSGHEVWLFHGRLPRPWFTADLVDRRVDEGFLRSVYCADLHMRRLVRGVEYLVPMAARAARLREVPFCELHELDEIPAEARS